MMGSAKPAMLPAFLGIESGDRQPVSYNSGKPIYRVFWRMLFWDDGKGDRAKYSRALKDK